MVPRKLIWIKDTSQIKASGDVVLLGGNLTLHLGDFHSKAGKQYVLIKSRQLYRRFSHVPSALSAMHK
ncbi:MAG: hypothetical protein ACTIM4_00740 [Marinomonas sp.]